MKKLINEVMDQTNQTEETAAVFTIIMKMHLTSMRENDAKLAELATEAERLENEIESQREYIEDMKKILSDQLDTSSVEESFHFSPIMAPRVERNLDKDQTMFPTKPNAADDETRFSTFTAPRVKQRVEEAGKKKLPDHPRPSLSRQKAKPGQSRPISDENNLVKPTARSAEEVRARRCSTEQEKSRAQKVYKKIQEFHARVEWDDKPITLNVSRSKEHGEVFLITCAECKEQFKIVKSKSATDDEYETTRYRLHVMLEHSRLAEFKD